MLIPMLDKNEFIADLLSWYGKHKRDLPWRANKDPYRVWISEIMLQQTQVATVIDYYRRFLEKFPDLPSLAKASEAEVIAQWSGLGYYSRARNLHAAAKKILAEHGGEFPRSPQDILALPGIGRYTLGAIASIAFEQALPLVDGNVIRVYSRLCAWKGSPSDAKFQKKIWALAEEIIHSEALAQGYGDFNQALMELGATICTPQNPACLLCPVQASCQGRRLGPEDYPEKKKAAGLQSLQREAAVIRSRDEVLLCLSDKHRWMKRLWQLPGLFVQGEAGAGRALLEHLGRLGIREKELKPLKDVRHQVTHHRITIRSYLLEVPNKAFQAPEGEKYEWHSLKQLTQLGIPAADRKILESLT